MSQIVNWTPEALSTEPSGTARLPLVAVQEISAAQGELIVPAVREASLALALSNYPARWRDSHGLRSEDFSAGTIAICRFNQSKCFELRSNASFATVVLRNKAFEQVRQQTREDWGAELQSYDAVKDATLLRLMTILLREKRAGFASGLFFLDGIATAMASYLMHHYSSTPPVENNFAGGMSPSVLRRCVEFMEGRLEVDLRLSEVAREAGLSLSHFIRSFRRSVGKTPYQFLLHRRVERAQTIMHDPRISLTEVALASGFADQHHLARVFRRITGVTPSAYRRSL